MEADTFTELLEPFQGVESALTTEGIEDLERARRDGPGLVALGASLHALESGVSMANDIVASVLAFQKAALPEDLPDMRPPTFGKQVELLVWLAKAGTTAGSPGGLPDLLGTVDIDRAPHAYSLKTLVRAATKKLGKAEGWSAKKDDLEAIVDESQREVRPQEGSFRDLVDPLVLFRNRTSHPDSTGKRWSESTFGPRMSDVLLCHAAIAAFELLDSPPLADVLGRWRVAAFEKQTSIIDNVTTARFSWEQYGSRYVTIEGISSQTDKWLVDRGPEWRGTIKAAPCCLFQTASDVLRTSTPTSVEIESRGTARIVGGLADVRSNDGRLELLPLPTDREVKVEIFTPNGDELGLRGDPSEWSDTHAAAVDAAQMIARERGAGQIRGQLQVTVPGQDLELAQGGASVVIAAARATAVGLEALRLDDGLQAEALRQAPTDAVGWRDYFGWVDAETTIPSGAPLQCPSLDLLLLTPLGEGHRARRIDTVKTLQPLEASSPPERYDNEYIGRRATEIAELLDKDDPNPYLAILRPLRTQFGAIGLLASPATWVAGLIFVTGASGMGYARKWLMSLNLPPSISVVQTRTYTGGPEHNRANSSIP